jgi:tRNA wybutosine-synthesizing protein 2
LPFREQVRALIELKWPEKQLLIPVPRGWKRVGHVAILNTPALAAELEEILGQAVLLLLARVGIETVAVRTAPTSDTFRKPDIRVIGGKTNTETIHREHGVKFKLDAAKITFSAGNLHERKRMIEIIRAGVLVDMFAAVGNLSLPAVAQRLPNLKALGIELNPLAYHYLSQTIKINGLTSHYQAILGDCRVETPQDIADYVIMGCWEADNEHLGAAIDALRQDQGGQIFLHTAEPRNQGDFTKKRVEHVVEKIASPLTIIDYTERKVKWISPSHVHKVADVVLRNPSF